MATHQSGINKDYHGGFLLDEAKIRKVADVLTTQGSRLNPPAEMEFEVHRADDSFYTTPDVGVVLADDNSAHKHITQIVIKLIKAQTAGSTDRNNRIAVVCFGTRREAPLPFDISDSELWFSVAGESRDWCFLLADDLDAQLKRISRNSKFTKIGVSLDLPVAVLFLMGVCSWSIHSVKKVVMPKIVPSAEAVKIMSTDEKLSTLIDVQRKYEALPPASFQDPTYAIWTMVLCTLIFLGRPLARLRNHLRRMVFYWGDMVGKYDAQEKAINNIKWGVIVAFFVGIATSYAYGWLTIPHSESASNMLSK